MEYDKGDWKGYAIFAILILLAIAGCIGISSDDYGNSSGAGREMSSGEVGGIAGSIGW